MFSAQDEASANREWRERADAPPAEAPAPRLNEGLGFSGYLQSIPPESPAAGEGPIERVHEARCRCCGGCRMSPGMCRDHMDKPLVDPRCLSLRAAVSAALDDERERAIEDSVRRLWDACLSDGHSDNEGEICSGCLAGGKIIRTLRRRP